ncbi:GT99 family glycosyltransferase N-terminal domain-containing protein [Candidatus Clostridium helianthi]|uniref:GT99 family glycosyltransferase N-terminal domain-containing protein n=1 Tax=Candidatus Clostridium helianthi TaxID=3381660 RepID=A0ABW8RZ30_9CLOT
MIVPFVFSLNPEKRFELDWVYYKFTSFCCKYDYPIIAQERYDFSIHDHFVNNKVFLDEPQHNWTDVICFREEQDKYIDKYFIPESISNTIINKYGSEESAYINYLIGENLELEAFLDETILKIEKKYERKITAFLNWNTSESLKKVADKHGIKVIHLELAPVRKYNYFHLGYFDFKGVHTVNSLEEQYYDFAKKNIDLPMLSNKELLALFLDREYLEYVYLLEREPEFKIGVVSSGKKNYFDIVRNNCDSNTLLTKTVENFDVKDILFRLHPADPLKKQLKGELDNKWNFDDSRSSLEFILKCESIANISSNMAFEAMLLGKKVYNLGKSPYQFCNLKDFDDKSEFKNINKFLNFVLFGYMIPFTFINDAQYLLWRCSEPNIEEIYLKNFRYYINKLNIDEKILLNKSDKRLQLILDKKGFSLKKSAEKYFLCIQDCHAKTEQLSEQCNKISNYISLNNQLQTESNNYKEQIRKLSEEKNYLYKQIEESNNECQVLRKQNADSLVIINELDKEKNDILLMYNSISNSTIWRITKPLRDILDCIKKLKGKGF